MPVPPLPLELVELIISHAAWGLPQDQRLEECGRLARVCKSWTSIAQQYALHALNLTIPPEDPPSETAVNRLLALPPHVLAYIQKLEIIPTSTPFVQSALSPMSSPGSLLPAYENALSALFKACPNIAHLAFWSQNISALSKTLDLLKNLNLQSLAVTVCLSHASHARSAGRIIAHRFGRLRHLFATLLLGADNDEPYEVDVPPQRMVVRNISIMSPRRTTSWFSTVVDHFLSSIDPSDLYCATGAVNGQGVGFAEWVARSARRSALSVRTSKSAFGGVLYALSSAANLADLIIRVPADETRPLQSPVPFDEMANLLPTTLVRIDLTDWIFEIPPSVGVVDEPVTAFDGFPILQVSAYPDQDAPPRVVDLVKLPLEDGSMLWHECPAEPDVGTSASLLLQ